MSAHCFTSHARRGLVALLGLAVVGCTTSPSSGAANTKEARIAALKQIGFVPLEDAWELNLGVKLLFGIDVDSVSAEGRAALSEVAHTLGKLGIARIRVEGHSDNVGDARYNLGLSQRRAESVAQHLIAIGWRDDAIERRAFGASKPVADNATPEGRTQNRRVVLAVQVD
jgi:outer membrane protein OmpA-like peptidoglycan-associated protein